MRDQFTAASLSSPRKMRAVDPPVMPQLKVFAVDAAPVPRSSVSPTISSNPWVIRDFSSATGETISSIGSGYLASPGLRPNSRARRGVKLRPMPPRHAYWTIIVDDQPTAFRAHDPEELLPTLNRLREKNPTAVMKWFGRGKLFDSRDQARDAGLGQGERRWEGPRPDRDDEGARSRGRGGEPRRGDAGPEGDRGQNRAPRDKNWRPGGEHRDPRQKYKEAKK